MAASKGKRDPRKGSKKWDGSISLVKGVRLYEAKGMRCHSQSTHLHAAVNHEAALQLSKAFRLSCLRIEAL
jgi:hypothetical protein